MAARPTASDMRGREREDLHLTFTYQKKAGAGAAGLDSPQPNCPPHAAAPCAAMPTCPRLPKPTGVGVHGRPPSVANVSWAARLRQPARAAANVTAAKKRRAASHDSRLLLVWKKDAVTTGAAPRRVVPLAVGPARRVGVTYRRGGRWMRRERFTPSHPRVTRLDSRRLCSYYLNRSLQIAST